MSDPHSQGNHVLLFSISSGSPSLGNDYWNLLNIGRTGKFLSAKVSPLGYFLSYDPPDVDKFPFDGVFWVHRGAQSRCMTGGPSAEITLCVCPSVKR